EGESSRILVGEPNQEAAAHRDPRARDAGHERRSLDRPHSEGVAPADAPGDSTVWVAVLRLRSASAERLGPEQKQAVDHEEERRRLRRGENGSQLVLE